MKHIPNLFTLLNLVFGCVAIVFILQTGETLLMLDGEGSWVPRLPEKIGWGAICIGIAAVIDFLDGFIARLFKASSEMGKQLDSLADVVSFGVAPGLILYQLLRISFIGEESGLDTSLWFFAPAVLIPCAGAWRLARFNIGSNTSGDFQGLPIPAAGLVIASLPLILFYDHLGLAATLTNKWFLYGVILLLAWLMVSQLRFIAFKFSGPVNNRVYAVILLLAAIVSILFLHWAAVPVIFIIYTILSLISKRQPT